MGIGTSIFLIAVGAILTYAVEATVSGLEINTIGIILMIVGALGLVISLLYAMVWADRTRPGVTAAAPAERVVVRDREIV